jgi:hypothetical protein
MTPFLLVLMSLFSPEPGRDRSNWANLNFYPETCGYSLGITTFLDKRWFGQDKVGNVGLFRRRLRSVQANPQMIMPH